MILIINDGSRLDCSNNNSNCNSNSNSNNDNSDDRLNYLIQQQKRIVYKEFEEYQKHVFDPNEIIVR